MFEQTDIDFIEYIRIIIKRKVLIAAGTFICFALAMVSTLNTAPEYESSAKLLVSQRLMMSTDGAQSMGEVYQSVVLSEKLANTFSQMLKGRVMAEEVIKKLGLPTTPEKLASKVNAKPIRDTQLIEITATDTSPVRAMRIVNALGNIFSDMADEVDTFSQRPLASVRIVEPAVKPTAPVKPKPLSNAIISIVLGLLASTGLAFLLERLDVSVKSAEETEKITGMTPLGRIPSVDGKILSVHLNPDSHSSEAYRSLRTNIQYLNFDKSVKTILITSPCSAEGKTTLCSNLATVLVQAGGSVLLIDCDLRRPRVHEVFGLENEGGLASVLASGGDIAGVLQSGLISGLSVITSGPPPPNPADLLGSERMQEILQDARKKFDYILLDSPPVLAVTDAAILASRVDGTLFSTIFSKTSRHTLIEAKESLEVVSARILGFVINGINSSGGYGYGYNYYSKKASSGPRSMFKNRRWIIASTFIFLALIAFLLGVYTTNYTRTAKLLLSLFS